MLSKYLYSYFDLILLLVFCIYFLPNYFLAFVSFTCLYIFTRLETNISFVLLIGMGNCCSCPHKSRKLSSIPYESNMEHVCSEEPIGHHICSDRRSATNPRSSPYYSFQYSIDDCGFTASRNCVLDAPRSNYISSSSSHHSAGRHSTLGPLEEIQHIAEREPESMLITANVFCYIFSVAFKISLKCVSWHHLFW